MQVIYTFILYLITPLVLLRLFWLGLKNPAYAQRWSERFGFLPDQIFDKPVLWIHAVSVGEVQATRPVVNQLLELYPHYQIVMTTVTPTGAFSVTQNYGASVCHAYFPYDLPFAVNRFINKMQPQFLIIMETELWPNLYTICRKRDIPVLLINARMSERSARGYKRFRSLTKQTLAALSVIAAQTRSDADRFIAMGAPLEKVIVTGNLKFDVYLPHSVIEQAQSIRRYFSTNRPVWIAASTHDGEEQLVIEAFRIVLEGHPSCLLIIAPRHPERFGDVIEMCKRSGLRTGQRTESEKYDTQTQVFVLDTLGELPMFYACSDVALVGGSLIPAGGHNLLEPASLGVPVVTGKHMFNFVEITQLLESAGALSIVSSTTELASTISGLLKDANLRHSLGEKARQVVEKNRGSSEAVMVILQEYLIRTATY